MSKYYLVRSLRSALLPIFLTSSIFANGQTIGDNLGKHTATRDLQMRGFSVKGINMLTTKGMVVGPSNSLKPNVYLQTEGDNKTILISGVNDLLNSTTPSIPATNAINGMLAYDNTTNKFYVYQNNTWDTFVSSNLATGRLLTGSSSDKIQSTTLAGDANINFDGTTTITVNAVTSDKIDDSAVIGGKVADSAITSLKIDNLSITTNNMAAQTITNDKFIGGNSGNVLVTNASGTVAWQTPVVGFGYEVGDIKPFLKLANNEIPPGWVSCDGQTLANAQSSLNGRVIPNLNNGTYVVGGAIGSSGTTRGSNSTNLTASNLPAITINSSVVSSAEGGTPTGSVALAFAAPHYMYYNDEKFSAGGTNYKDGSNTYDAYAGNDVSFTSTSLGDTGSAANHNHTAGFSGAALAAHNHTFTVPLNGTTQTPINIQPQSNVVTWIMRIL
jgi:hypothetical protein